MMWLLFLAILPIVSGECPKDWSRFQKTCLALFKTQQSTWPEAQATCRSFNGRLATLENQEKDINMRKFLQTMEQFDGVSVWVGGTDSVKESHWVWNDNDIDTFTYTNWDHGQPNNLNNNEFHGENCLALHVDRLHYGWMDNSCDERKLSFVCEKDFGYFELDCHGSTLPQNPLDGVFIFQSPQFKMLHIISISYFEYGFTSSLQVLKLKPSL